MKGYIRVHYIANHNFLSSLNFNNYYYYIKHFFMFNVFYSSGYTNCTHFLHLRMTGEFVVKQHLACDTDDVENLVKEWPELTHSKLLKGNTASKK